MYVQIETTTRERFPGWQEVTIRDSGCVKVRCPYRNRVEALQSAKGVAQAQARFCRDTTEARRWLDLAAKVGEIIQTKEVCGVSD